MCARRLGQHFLKNKSALKKIAAALDLKKDEIVIEIGPGHGELTSELLKYPITVIGIEKDWQLAKKLQVPRSKLQINSKFQIIKGDVLKELPLLSQTLYPKPYTLVGNIPFYLTGYLLRLIGELENKPSLIVFTLQKEVAERIAAQPPKMNKLAASVQFWADPEIIDYLKPVDFDPPPKVKSAIIRLNVKGQRSIVEQNSYYKLVRILFRQPRKTVKNNLRGIELEEKFKDLGLTGQERPQNLSIEVINKLSRLIH